MPVLERLNQIKKELSEIREEAVSTLDKEVLPEFVASFDSLVEKINQTGSIIEKHYQDDENVEVMKTDLIDQMNKDEKLYGGVPKEKRDAIAEKIIANPKINLANEEDLRHFIANDLADLSPKELVGQAYDKDEIIRLGRSISDEKASDGVRYSAGLKQLMDLAESPQGFEEIQAQAEKRILDKPKERLRYLYKYYEV
jgi:hypothetical protein